jgi:outer membrane protein OmpA-like peptidoglycan-associated protein
VPYLTAGAGFVTMDETHFAHNIGVGAKYFITDIIGVRIDFRGWFSPDAPAQDEYAHFAAMLGADIQLGGDDDIDDDGVLNRDDKCSQRRRGPGRLQGRRRLPRDRQRRRRGRRRRRTSARCRPRTRTATATTTAAPTLDDDGDGIQNDATSARRRPRTRTASRTTTAAPILDNDKDGVLDAGRQVRRQRRGQGRLRGHRRLRRPRQRQGRHPGCHATSAPVKPRSSTASTTPDGCPDQSLVKLADKKIEILEKVYFVTGKDKIDEKSNPLLSQVASVLKAKPGIKKLEVQGYTDNSGNGEDEH